MFWTKFLSLSDFPASVVGPPPSSVFIDLYPEVLQNVDCGRKAHLYSGLSYRPVFFAPLHHLERPSRKAVSGDSTFCPLGSRAVNFSHLPVSRCCLFLYTVAYNLTNSSCLSSSLSCNALLRAARKEQPAHIPILFPSSAFTDSYRLLGQSSQSTVA